MKNGVIWRLHPFHATGIDFEKYRKMGNTAWRFVCTINVKPVVIFNSKICKCKKFPEIG